MKDVDAGTVGDVAKRLHHRLLARELAHDPEMLGRARSELDRLAARYPGYGFVEEWRRLMEMPTAVLRRRLTAHGAEMERLRISSPFYLASRDPRGAEYRHRIRIMRIARRIARRAAGLAVGPRDAAERALTDAGSREPPRAP